MEVVFTELFYGMAIGILGKGMKLEGLEEIIYGLNRSGNVSALQKR